MSPLQGTGMTGAVTIGVSFETWLNTLILLAKGILCGLVILFYY